MLATATAELRSNRDALGDKTVLLLDVAIGSKAEAAFIKAVIAAAQIVDRHDSVRRRRAP